jgi:hypothetical protein
MAARWEHNARDLKTYLERQPAVAYPFYCVLLYKPTNALNARLHEYVVRQWEYLDELTGQSCLLLAIENPYGVTRIQNFKPQQVYEVARYLGAPADALPCMVLFTEPETRRDTLVIRLRHVLPPSKDLTDEDITNFFQHLQTAIDSCAATPDERLACLERALRGPSGISQLPRAATKAKNWLLGSAAVASTVAMAGEKVLEFLHQIGVVSH